MLMLAAMILAQLLASPRASLAQDRPAAAGVVMTVRGRLLTVTDPIRAGPRH